MIGQPFEGTLWRCTFSYKTGEGDAERHVSQQRFIVTADPAGGDILDVTRLVVLGRKPEPVRDFMLLEGTRIGEIAGLGVVMGADRGWPAGLEVGSVVLDATSRAQATIGDLRRALVLKDIAIEELEKKVERLEALQPNGEEPRA